MVETTLQKDQVRATLMEKAHRQGFITYDDILSMMPDVERDVALLDDLMDELLEADIEVIPGSGSPTGDDAANEEDDTEELIIDNLGEDEDDEEDIEDQALKFRNDLIEDAGYQAALDTDDVVGLYLKEAGRVPLLTAEEEVSLAKRMEAAVWAREKMEQAGEELLWSEEQGLREVVMDGEAAQEHLIRERPSGN